MQEGGVVEEEPPCTRMIEKKDEFVLFFKIIQLYKIL